MKKCVMKILVFFFFVFLVVGCKKKETAKTTEAKKTVEATPVDETIRQEVDSVVAANNEKQYHPEKAKVITLKTEFKNVKKQPRASAHEKYVKEPTVFVPFDFSTEESPDNVTAVVGSDVCKFYLGATIKSFDDVQTLKSDILIPIGTVLKLKSCISVDENDSDKKIITGEFYKTEYGSVVAASKNTFEFEDEWNYFYTTEYQGKTGLVFGADLKGKDSNEFTNQGIAALYKTNGAPKQFLPIGQRRPLTPEVKSSLERYRLAFEAVPAEKIYGFDDMVSLYTSEIRGRYSENDAAVYQPIFITSDFVSHAKHVIFDESLQLAEQNFFIPKLGNLVDGFLAALQKVNTAESKITAGNETLQKARDYFNVAKALIEMITKSGADALAHYDETVKREIELIENAAGLETSPLFTFADGSSNREDYSQYKPRGHYTKTPALEAYFKTMMWFGRTHFIISEGSNEGTVPVSTVDELTKNMLPIALLITDVVNQDSNLLQHWKNIFDPITALIGLSDDLSFYECLPLWKNLGVTDLAAWSDDPKNISAFVKLATEKLNPPAISGNSVFQSASAGIEKNRKPPMGFRLFGQRYTIDSFIFHETSAPRMQDIDEQGNRIGRMMVSALDVLTALGSERANSLLGTQYKTFKKLPDVLTAFKNAIEKNGAEKAFGKTYYGSVLQEIAAIASFERGAGFYFTETPYWDLKQLNTGLGVYAELKHDTILYIKQSAAEMGGGADCTYRTKEVPKLLDYVEPNLPYFETVTMSLSFLYEIYKNYELADENTLDYIQQCIKQCQTLLEIVKLEIQDKPVSAELLAEIQKTPSVLGSCMQFQRDYGNWTDTKNTAIVADVFTNAETGEVLELGTGIPYRIYVALNDGQGGKRIAVGYCFNAYEFTQAMNDRLTDEQWQEKVYKQSDEKMREYKPYWLDQKLFEK